MQVLIFFSIFIGLLYFKRLYVKKLIFITSLLFIAHTSTTIQVLNGLLDCIAICSRSARAVADNNKAELFNQVTRSLDVPFKVCVDSSKTLFKNISSNYDDNVFNIYDSIYIGTPKELRDSLVASSKDMVADLANIVKYYAKSLIIPVNESIVEKAIIDDSFKHFARKLRYINNVNFIPFTSLGTTKGVLNLMAQKEFMYFMLSKVINPIIESLISSSSISDIDQKRAEMNVLIDKLDDLTSFDLQDIFTQITLNFNLSKQIKKFEGEKMQFLNILKESVFDATASFSKILLDLESQKATQNIIETKIFPSPADTTSSDSPSVFFNYN